MGDHGKKPNQRMDFCPEKSIFFSTEGQSYEMKIYYCLIPCNV